jgi:hypothetical protein
VCSTVHGGSWGQQVSHCRKWKTAGVSAPEGQGQRSAGHVECSQRSSTDGGSGCRADRGIFSKGFLGSRGFFHFPGGDAFVCAHPQSRPVPGTQDLPAAFPRGMGEPRTWLCLWGVPPPAWCILGFSSLRIVPSGEAGGLSKGTIGMGDWTELQSSPGSASSCVKGDRFLHSEALPLPKNGATEPHLG